MLILLKLLYLIFICFLVWVGANPPQPPQNDGAAGAQFIGWAAITIYFIIVLMAS
jgi:hypothetical protein